MSPNPAVTFAGWTVELQPPLVCSSVKWSKGVSGMMQEMHLARGGERFQGPHPVQAHKDREKRAEEGQAGQAGRCVGWESVTLKLTGRGISSWRPVPAGVQRCKQAKLM